VSIFSDLSALLAEARVQTRIFKDIARSLANIEKELAPRPAVAGKLLVGGKPIVGLQVQDVQTLTATFQFVDADKNPTTIPPVGMTGAPVWSSSDPTKASVTPAPDGMSAVIAAGAVLGDVQINVTVPGTAITDQGTLTIVAGPPAGGVLSFGVPTP